MPDPPFGAAPSPFVAGHDGRFIFPARKRMETIALLRTGVAESRSPILVTGGSGVGKTSLAWEALGGSEPGFRLAVIARPVATPAELLEALAMQLGLARPEPGEAAESLARLEQHLRAQASGGTPVLLLDDAHGLEAGVLEQVQTLSAWEHEGRRLLAIVLVGLPELERRLGRPELEALRGRIALHLRVFPLTEEETARYLHHRVAAAGADAGSLFPAEACREIHRYTYGLPRDVNALAGRALDRARRQGMTAVSAEHVREAVMEARLRGEAPADPPRIPADGATESPVAAAKAEEAAPARSGPGGRSSRRRARGAAAMAKPARPSRPAAPEAAVPDVREAASGAVESEAPEVAASVPTDAGGEAPEGPTSPAHRRHGSGRSRRSGRAVQWGLAVAAVALIGTILMHAKSWTPAPAPGTSPVPAVQGRLETPPAAPVARPRAAAPAGTAAPRTATSRAGGAPSPTATRAEARGADPAAETPAASEVPPRPFGLEVGAYLDLDRATAEGERLLQSAGLACAIIEDREADAFRVVLGSFASRRAAERAADDLLGRGLVEQARVVRLPGEQPGS